MVPCLVINLPTSVARRSVIGAALQHQGIAFEFLPATDGRTLSDEALAALAPAAAQVFDRPLTPGEIGCAHSHLQALRAVADGPDEFVCVLEDDAQLREGFRLALDIAALASLPRFDVLRLVSDPGRWRFAAWQLGALNGFPVFVAGRPGFGSQAQIWTRTGAERYLERVSVVQAPSDFMLYHDCHVPGLRVLEIRPGVVEHDRQFEDAAHTAFSDIGERPLSLPRTLHRRLSKRRRKLMAARSFLAAWGLAGVARLVASAPPGRYFR